MALVLVLPQEVSATGITGGDGVNYVGLYTFNNHGSPSSESFPSPTAPKNYTVTLDNQSFTNVSDGSTAALSILKTKANSTDQCYYVGGMYNGTTVDVTVYGAMCELPDDNYGFLGHVTYLVAPTGTEQYGVGNVLNGDMEGSLAAQFRNASAALSSVGSTNEGSGNATIRAWGVEESTIVAGLTTLASMIPSAVNALEVQGSYFVVSSEYLTGDAYDSAAPVFGPLPVAHGPASAGKNGCTPFYAIGANPGEEAYYVLICVEIVATALLLIYESLVLASLLGCAATVGLGCLVAAVIGIVGSDIFLTYTEKCYEQLIAR
ncbi:MAG: hypothetical protein L3K16_08925 [Thermoplasmata archaeon]|nr:hypothetical protein [Thermoplasmata archaeon]